jgi:hypothetical protein
MVRLRADARGCDGGVGKELATAIGPDGALYDSDQSETAVFTICNPTSKRRTSPMLAMAIAVADGVIAMVVLSVVALWLWSQMQIWRAGRRVSSRADKPEVAPAARPVRNNP